jgi:hypothetical protein
MIRVTEIFKADTATGRQLPLYIGDELLEIKYSDEWVLRKHGNF